MVFVPTRDPNRYPVCEPCKAILDQIKAGLQGLTRSLAAEPASAPP